MGRLNWMGCVLLLVLGARPALAVDDAGTARRLYGEAREAFGRGEHPQALRLLKEAYELERNPLYIYNVARVQEAMGDLAEAYGTFLRVAALEIVEAELRALAQGQANRLEPLTQKALVHFAPLDPGATLQLDDHLVADPAQDEAVAPGWHQLCAIYADRGWVDCWRRNLRAGHRLDLPGPRGPRGSLTWKPGEAVAVIRLDGVPLLIDWSRAWTIEVDAGSRPVEAVDPGGTKVALDVPVLSGQGGSLDGVIRRARLEALPRPEVTAWPWVTSGLGLAGAAIGVICLVRTRDIRQEVHTAGTDDAGNVNGLTQSEAKQRWDEAAAFEIGGGIALGVGLAALAAGIVWGSVEVVEANAFEKKLQGLSVWVAPQVGPGLSLGGRF
jgi:hypothetical protein